MKKETLIAFAIPEEDANFEPILRIFNVKIPLKIIMNQVLPLIKKGKICLNCGGEKKGGYRLSEWCADCLEKVCIAETN